MTPDNENTYCTEQAITQSAASDDLINHLVAEMCGDKQRPPKLLVMVMEDFATLTSLTCALQTDTVENFASPTTLQQQTIALADLVAGAKFNLGGLPVSGLQQYSRLYFTVTGPDATAGSITAFWTPSIQAA